MIAFGFETFYKMHFSIQDIVVALFTTLAAFCNVALADPASEILVNEDVASSLNENNMASLIKHVRAWPSDQYIKMSKGLQKNKNLTIHIRFSFNQCKYMSLHIYLCKLITYFRRKHPFQETCGCQ